MHRFQAWAPLAARVAVTLHGMALPMEGPDTDGWWHLDVGAGGAGTDYGFLVDQDEKAYPDPRSQWQPNGVHGLSRVYDQGAFGWNDDRFQPHPIAGAVIYELHLGTFTEPGTLDSAVEKLGYLADLGITHVELMPVAAFAGNYGWGYDGVALYAVHEPYGGPDALKRFVDAAHTKGLAVLLDVVYNHFGPVGNYTGKFGPYLTGAHKTPWGGAVNLEAAWSDEVRRFFCDNARMWLRDYHLDGLRLDAVHAFVDRSAIHFLEQLASEVEDLSAALGRKLTLIAESDLNDPRLVTPREACGLGMDAQWSDDFHHALFCVLSRGKESGYFADFGTLASLAKALERTFVYDGIYSRYRRRVHGRSAAHLGQHRFLGYIQNHDQVGNRATGDRIAEAAGFERAKIAAAFVLMSPFIPMLFQGEEWAATAPFQYFANHDDPTMAKAVREGRRRDFAAFGWAPGQIPDPESPDTFARSKLNWKEAGSGRHAEMLQWYRDLIRLRRATPWLNNGEPGNTRVRFDEQARWISLERGPIAMVANLGASERTIAVPPRTKILLASGAIPSIGSGCLALGADTVAILRSDDRAQPG